MTKRTDDEVKAAIQDKKCACCGAPVEKAGGFARCTETGQFAWRCSMYHCGSTYHFPDTFPTNRVLKCSSPGCGASLFIVEGYRL